MIQRAKRIRKTTLVFAMAIIMVLGTFTTSLAASNFNFILYRGIPSKSALIKKSKNSKYGSVTITYSSAPSYQTDFIIMNSDGIKMSLLKTVNNSNRKATKLPYLNNKVDKKVNVRIQGADSKLTAPNGSTVKGTWSAVADN